MDQQIQQEIRNERTLDKARVIAAAKHVRRYMLEGNRKIWLVGSQSTPKKFYCVTWDEMLESFVCDCKAFQFSADNTCKHIYSCAIYESESA